MSTTEYLTDTQAKTTQVAKDARPPRTRWSTGSRGRRNPRHSGPYRVVNHECSATTCGLARETSQVLGKVFTALRSEGIRLADVAHDLHLRPADLNDLVFGLVVTAQDGGGRRTVDGTRTHLSVVPDRNGLSSLS